jgi:hypothetical protein
MKNLEKLYCYCHPEEILTDAYETGTLFWAYIIKLNRRNNGEIFQIILEDFLDKNHSVYEINTDIIRLGIKRLLDGEAVVASWIVDQIWGDNLDVDGYNCIVQAGLFNEVKYD